LHLHWQASGQAASFFSAQALARRIGDRGQKGVYKKELGRRGGRRTSMEFLVVFSFCVSFPFSFFLHSMPQDIMHGQDRRGRGRRNSTRP
jgi:hypothetical protein